MVGSKFNCSSILFGNSIDANVLVRHKSLLRTAELLKIKGLCDINERCEEYSEPVAKKKLKLPENLIYQHQKLRLLAKNKLTQTQLNVKDLIIASNINNKHSNSINILSNINTANINDVQEINDLSTIHQQLHRDDPIIDNNGIFSSSVISKPTQIQEIFNIESNREKNMTSLEMGVGMNGSLMGVSLQYLEFAPEPPAPSATPVTGHIELNSINQAQDQEIRRKFETLRSLDPCDNLEVDRSLSQHEIHQMPQTLSQSEIRPLLSPHDFEPSTQEHTDTIIIKQEIIEGPRRQQINDHIQSLQIHQIQQHEHQLQPQNLISDEQQSHHDGNQSHPNNMDIDHPGLCDEHGMIVTMMTPTHLDNYQSDDTCDDSQMLSNADIKVEYTELISPNDPRNLLAPKAWTQEDMESALDALRTHNMSLTKASVTYGIPSTTLWQRAHRLGIDTPKKEGPNKSWNEDSLNHALEALRTGLISANKASKAYGIPSSTLYKIARREGIRLAAPFNAAPTNWSPEDLEKALEAIRSGQSSVQKASVEFGIPTGTLYGRCKREGIELSRSNPTPWSEDAMHDALDAVRVGQMSINQAAIHYNLPYSSLYGRFKRGKYDTGSGESHLIDTSPECTQQYSPVMLSHQHSSPSLQLQHQMHEQQHNTINHHEMYQLIPKIERS